MSRIAFISAMLLAAALGCQPCRAQDSRAAQLLARFQSESDAIGRAKLMPQLGEAELQDVRTSVDAGKFDDALATLKAYRDQVQLCENALDARHTNAEKHPSGFKQLQISLREALRRLNEICAGLTADNQAAFAPLRNDLDAMNRHLVQELFPPDQPSGSTQGAPQDKENH